MKMIYTAADQGQVYLAQNILENEGIECVVRGEHLATASGGIAPVDAWLEVWLIDPADRRVAQALIDGAFGDASEEQAHETWMCPECLERIEGQFSQCWNCGTERAA